MQVSFVDVSRQYEAIKHELKDSLENVMQKGHFILGDEVEQFEKEFAEFCGVKHCVGVASGTDALHLALRALGIGEGDEVLLPANTFIATALAVSYVGAQPVFVDVEPRTYTIDVDKLREKINKKTKAIIAVHLYGQMADMDGLMALAKEFHLRVIEDACQAHGALYKNKKAGSFGDIACFSFYPTKNLGCYGDGGAVVTQNDEFAARIQSLRNYGQTEKYHYREIGYNSRLDEVQAAVLRVKLRHLPSYIEARRTCANAYAAELRDTDLVIPEEDDGRYHTYHLYVVRTAKRDALVEWLTARGVTTLIHYPVPLHLQEAYEPLQYHAGDFPIAEQCSQEILSLPMFPELKKEEVTYVTNAIGDFFKAQHVL